MTDVIKRNGQTEPFREEKVRNSLESATRDAGYDPQEKRNLIDKTVQDVTQNVQNTDQVKAGQIRNLILNDIEEEEQEAGSTDIAAAWRNYEDENGIDYPEQTGGRRHILDSFKRGR